MQFSGDNLLSPHIELGAQRMNRRQFTAAVLHCCFLSVPCMVWAQPAGMERIDAFVWNGPTFLKKASPEEIRSLGKVLRESSEVTPSPNADGNITYRTFQLAGLQIQQRSFGEPIQHQFVSVTVVSSHWSIRDGLVVGAPVNRLLKVLGGPTERTSDQLTYQGESERVVFKTKNGRIAQIQFVYYAD